MNRALDVENLTADARLYTAVIQAHAQAGQTAEALAVEQRMLATGVQPTVFTYNTLMSVCARQRNKAGVLKYFNRMTESGIRPTVRPPLHCSRVL